MSDDLLRKLQLLEEDYLSQPPYVQKTDLGEINHLRSQLGMPLVDAQLRVIGAKPTEEAKPPPAPTPDWSEAQAIYDAYLKKTAELQPHRVYAEQVAQATAGAGMTPVRPLATMGTGGGPLLCDVCGKPIVLEGGEHHGLTADVAWKQNPHDPWVSWILGGMVVETEINGTLRIYHGYAGRRNDCCEVASRRDAEARAKFSQGQGADKEDMMLAFLKQKFPRMTEEECLRRLDQVMKTLYSYDPGIGVNRPS